MVAEAGWAEAGREARVGVVEDWVGGVVEGWVAAGEVEVGVRVEEAREVERVEAEDQGRRCPDQCWWTQPCLTGKRARCRTGPCCRSEPGCWTPGWWPDWTRRWGRCSPAGCRPGPGRSAASAWTRRRAAGRSTDCRRPTGGTSGLSAGTRRPGASLSERCRSGRCCADWSRTPACWAACRTETGRPWTDPRPRCRSTSRRPNRERQCRGCRWGRPSPPDPQLPSWRWSWQCEGSTGMSWVQEEEAEAWDMRRRGLCC